jgi:hypothetical protein
MKNPVEVMAATLKDQAHSFAHIRGATGLQLTDQQFSALVESNPARFKLVRMTKRDATGEAIRPGKLGARMRTAVAV